MKNLFLFVVLGCNLFILGNSSAKAEYIYDGSFDCKSGKILLKRGVSDTLIHFVYPACVITYNVKGGIIEDINVCEKHYKDVLKIAFKDKQMSSKLINSKSSSEFWKDVVKRYGLDLDRAQVIVSAYVLEHERAHGTMKACDLKRYTPYAHIAIEIGADMQAFHRLRQKYKFSQEEMRFLSDVLMIKRLLSAVSTAINIRLGDKKSIPYLFMGGEKFYISSGYKPFFDKMAELLVEREDPDRALHFYMKVMNFYMNGEKGPSPFVQEKEGMTSGGCSYSRSAIIFKPQSKSIFETRQE